LQRTLRAPLLLSLALVALAAASLDSAPASASRDGAASIAYRFTFPEPEHHWMQAEIRFAGLDLAPLELRMSRSSPGRYAVHDFAKNVYDVRAMDPDGRELTVTRPDPHGWTVPQHGPALTVRYKVFGDRVDGTYLAVDRTHAHINMPAAIMWARGLDERPSTLTFEPPVGLLGDGWRVATQLYPGSTPFEFTAPNLQYLMDSPAEFAPLSIRQFDIDGRAFRFAAHHTGTADELESLVKDVEKIIREQRVIFGEYPAYEPGHYTFLADYLPYASTDAMEHRNSTVMTSAASIRDHRAALLDTVAHEFFHGWNIERIRPRSLEPFDFERANMSAELWLGEGFTQYYGPLSLIRAGLENLRNTAGALTILVGAVSGPGRDVRSATEMSRMAPFIDGGRPIDVTNWDNTYISYYSFGGAIALGLDLTLRIRSDHRVTLDDFMRAMWRAHGKPGGAPDGHVSRPYTLEDAERRLAEVAGDATFARNFFARFVHGREVLDYARLLQPAGLLLKKVNSGRAWWGDVALEQRGGLRVTAPPLSNTPFYRAGLDLDDEIRQIDGARVSSPDAAAAILRRHRPGDTLSVEFVDRSGRSRTATVVLLEDPRVDIVPVEAAGGRLTAEQRAFRTAWLGQP
jgi:predicted metalloprotease with PDZ domain